MSKFVTPDDVIDRYEGDFPSDRDTWLTTRIDDVEADLILMVPSLGTTPVDQIASARLQRVKALVADKVLELYRNPERAKTRTQAAGPYNETTSYDSGSSSGSYFTEDEVAKLRLPSTNRANLGVAHIKPSLNRCW